MSRVTVRGREERQLARKSQPSTRQRPGCEDVTSGAFAVVGIESCYVLLEFHLNLSPCEEHMYKKGYGVVRDPGRFARVVL